MHHDREPSQQDRERALRQRLGIPDDAERAIVFAESSHWDPNWLMTSEAYYDRFVRGNLDRALDALHQEPRRVYSIECVFFLRMYWERCPEKQDAVRELVNKGRLRLTHSGVTTADTLIPSVEALLRDCLIGQEWLRANGMTQEPRLAYLTDSFGASPGLPSLLRAAGFDRTAITRIDGMHFVGCDFEPASNFPRPGSSAERLQKEERTLDFWWRDANGAKVLCHWNAFTYGQGDLIAHRGVSRLYIVPLAFPDRSERHVARRIGEFVAQLDPYRRTPYMFCPIGFDFVPPLPDLLALLDRYNRVRYPTTGVWAVNAGLDDYMELVECYGDELPVLELDPNPYWTGFYTARPVLKQRCHELVDSLLLAERLACLPERAGDAAAINRELEEPWWYAVVSNHHDFITGTSPDSVVVEEQVPWLERAAAKANEAVSRLAPSASTKAAARPRATLPEWHREGSKVEVQTAHCVVELDEQAGGTITRALDSTTQRVLLDAPSNDLILYKESGGLWRMGHEFVGGSLERVARSSEVVTKLRVQEHDDCLEVSCDVDLEGEMIRRTCWFSVESPLIRFRITGRSPDRHTIAVHFATSIAAELLAMDAPGCVIARPPKRIYDPTFWPLYGFAHLQDGVAGYGVAWFQRLPGAVSYERGGDLEAVAIRNATRERAFGFVPLPANPATGHERSVYAFDYALLFTASGDWRANGLPAAAQRLAETSWGRDSPARLYDEALRSVVTDRSDVFVSAVKPASRGEGLIARLYTLSAVGEPVTVASPGRMVRAAFLCDARERDLAPLSVQDGTVRLTMPGTSATVRLLT